MGGTFMRQHNFIFDVENNKLGLAHATCHDDPNQTKQVLDLIDGGYSELGEESEDRK